MKKKLFLALWTLVLGLFMYGCETPTEGTDYQKVLIEAADTLSLVEETTASLDLVSTMTYEGLEINLSWTSNNSDVINNTGLVTRPTFTQGDVLVRLTAIFEYDTYKFSKVFDVKVIKLDQEIYYLVTFNSNGGNTINAIQVKENTVVTKPSNPIKTGYTFVNWHQDSENGDIYDFSTPITADITLYASYTQDEVPLTSLSILYLNDLHGSIEKKDSEIGLAYIANYVEGFRNRNPKGTILLAGGDMFQGSALSNYYQGRSTLEIMNTMGFDAMVLGNHEFDWGLDVVTGYFDGNTENGEASFPLLGANVFYQGTTNIVEHIDPYTIIERDGIKIGIIGTMGYGLEQSIAQSRIDGFVFASPSDYIETYATHLRTEEDVDYVFALTHDPGDLNQTVAGFTGDAKVDIIFNAHSHSRYTTTINNTSIIQSGSNGKYVGTITIDLTTNGITMKNEASSADFYKANADVQTLIDTYKAETDTLFNTEIIQSGAYASQTHLSNWLTDLMVAKTGADIAFHNYGGTRTYISEDESITLGKLYQIFPFDNIIKTVELDGSAINTFINKGNAYSTTVSEFQTGTKYLVATNDYLFDKTDNPFIYGDNPNYDGTLLRDMVEAELKLQALVYNNFTVDNPLLTNAVTQTSTYQAIINFYN
jgi:uncharacterized repeat protein (TIGR02543 family)